MSNTTRYKLFVSFCFNDDDGIGFSWCAFNTAYNKLTDARVLDLIALIKADKGYHTVTILNMIWLDGAAQDEEEKSDEK